MKRLIYITITYILLAAVSHAKSWFETHPNYFATAAINDADSITFDEYFTGGTIALRSPAISKGDTIWTLFCLVFTLNIEKHDFDIEPRLYDQYSYQKLPGPKAAPLDSIQQKTITQELCRIYSKDIMFRNMTFDEVYKFYEQYSDKSWMPDSTQSKKLVLGINSRLFLIPPAEKATEAQTEAKQ